MVAHGIARAIDAEYGVAGGLVACADYSGSLTMDQLLMRLGKYNRQSEALRVGSRGLTAGGPVVFGMVA
jgi:hypothetical protein